MELAALNERTDYQVCTDDTDPRGWQLVDANQILLGRAIDLIIDLHALTARYIVCSIEAGTARRVLIPTGFARLDDEAEVVHLDFVTAATVAELPDYVGLPLDPAFAEQLERVLTGDRPPAAAEAKIIRRNP